MDRDGQQQRPACRSVNATVPVQTPTLRVADCGDAAIRVTASGTDAERRWRAVHHLADVLTAADIPGRSGVVPTYESVLIEFDAVHTDHAAISRVVTRVADELRHADPADRRMVGVHVFELNQHRFVAGRGPEACGMSAAVSTSARWCTARQRRSFEAVTRIAGPGSPPPATSRCWTGTVALTPAQRVPLLLPVRIRTIRQTVRSKAFGQASLTPVVAAELTTD